MSNFHNSSATLLAGSIVGCGGASATGPRPTVHLPGPAQLRSNHFSPPTHQNPSAGITEASQKPVKILHPGLERTNKPCLSQCLCCPSASLLPPAKRHRKDLNHLTSGRSRRHCWIVHWLQNRGQGCVLYVYQRRHASAEIAISMMRMVSSLFN